VHARTQDLSAKQTMSSEGAKFANTFLCKEIEKRRHKSQAESCFEAVDSIGAW